MSARILCVSRVAILVSLAFCIHVDISYSAPLNRPKPIKPKFTELYQKVPQRMADLAKVRQQEIDRRRKQFEESLLDISDPLDNETDEEWEQRVEDGIQFAIEQCNYYESIKAPTDEDCEQIIDGLFPDE